MGNSKNVFELGITNEDIMKFYWLAMEKSGWHNEGVKKYSEIFFPHEKKISFQSEKFLFVDKYETNPFSDNSAGAITIYFLFKDEWLPVWKMSYGGKYPKEVIYYLKTALRYNIRQKKFEGGRGPIYFKIPTDELLYTNNSTGSFADFQGKEKIFAADTNKQLGFHRFFGMSLL